MTYASGTGRKKPQPPPTNTMTKTTATDPVHVICTKNGLIIGAYGCPNETEAIEMLDRIMSEMYGYLFLTEGEAIRIGAYNLGYYELNDEGVPRPSSYTGKYKGTKHLLSRDRACEVTSNILTEEDFVL